MPSLQPCLLLMAESDLQDALASAIRTNGYEVHACQTPLDAVQVLEQHSSRICYAVLSLASPRALEVGSWIEQEYPSIERLVLSA